MDTKLYNYLLTQENKFWERVNKSCKGWCRERTGALDSGWYWHVLWKKTLSTHRLSYMYYHKININSETHILHTCNNRKCVNPHHLNTWDHKKNMHDRSDVGNHNWGTCLDKEKVIKAIKLLDEWKTPLDIAKIIWVTKSSINNLSQWKSWRHITWWKIRRHR